MKKTVAALVLAVIAIPSFALAAQFKSGDLVNIGAGETISDNFYVAGGTVNITGNIDGDLTAIGGNVNIFGSVKEDAIIAGGTVVINGNVGDDIRVAGGTVTINGKVGGDLLVAGGTVIISSSATIGGDLIARGGTITNQALVTGKTNIVAAPEAKNETKGGKKALGALFVGFVTAWWIIKTLSMLLAGWVIYTLTKSGSQQVVNTAVENFGKEFGRGFLVMIASPVILILLAITVIGIPFSIFGLMVYTALSIASCVFGSIIFSGIVAKIFKKSYKLTPGLLLGGIFLYQIAGVLPLAGWVISFVFFMTGLGVLSQILYSQTIGKWRQQPPTI